jgi:hypothetical protein
LTATPREVTCGEIGTVAKIIAANSRPMTDHVFIVFLLVFNATKKDHAQLRTAIPGKSKHTSGAAYENRRVERGNQDQGTTNQTGRGFLATLAACGMFGTFLVQASQAGWWRYLWMAILG